MRSDESHDALEVALQVAAALEAVGAHYFIGGSVASSLQGEPRATNDIDIVVSLSPAKVGAFALALGPSYEVDQEMLRDALTRRSCANIFYLPRVTKIDIFGLGDGAFDEAEFGRRRRVSVSPTGAELFVKSPEDTVLQKLRWFRLGGEVSERQWRDVVSVLQTMGADLDDAYLQSVAVSADLVSLLDRARAAALAP